MPEVSTRAFVSLIPPHPALSQTPPQCLDLGMKLAGIHGQLDTLALRFG
ncbi:hypothetical protein [Methylobacterium sp. Leaf91]|nr:hypothetical protein [Methylobacterium sp. Leaf91]